MDVKKSKQAIEMLKKREEFLNIIKLIENQQTYSTVLKINFETTLSHQEIKGFQVDSKSFALLLQRMAKEHVIYQLKKIEEHIEKL